MNIPGLPAEFALPAVDRAFTLTVLLATLLGGLAVDVLLTLRPFSRHRPSHMGSLLGLVMLIGGCLVFGAVADRGQTPLIVAAVAAALGAFAYWGAHHKIVAEPDAGAAGLLTDADLRRAKTRSDRWVLVTGLAGSGKRCQRMTVSGCTITRVERQPGQYRESHDQKRRSAGFVRVRAR